MIESVQTSAQVISPEGKSQLQKSKLERYPLINNQILKYLEKIPRKSDILVVGLGKLQEPISLVGRIVASESIPTPNLSFADILPSQEFSDLASNPSIYQMPTNVFTGQRIIPIALKTILDSDGKLPSSVQEIVQAAVENGIFGVNVENPNQREMLRGSYDIVSMNNVFQYITPNFYQEIVEFLVEVIKPGGIISIITDDKLVNYKIKEILNSLGFYAITEGLYQEKDLANSPIKVEARIAPTEKYQVTKNLADTLNFLKWGLDMLAKVSVVPVEVRSAEDIKEWLKLWNATYLASIFSELLEETKKLLTLLPTDQQKNLEITIQPDYFLESAQSELPQLNYLIFNDLKRFAAVIKSWIIDPNPILPKINLRNIATGEITSTQNNLDITSLVDTCKKWREFLD